MNYWKIFVWLVFAIVGVWVVTWFLRQTDKVLQAPRGLETATEL